MIIVSRMLFCALLISILWDSTNTGTLSGLIILTIVIILASIQHQQDTKVLKAEIFMLKRKIQVNDKINHLMKTQLEKRRTERKLNRRNRKNV